MDSASLPAPAPVLRDSGQPLQLVRYRGIVRGPRGVQGRVSRFAYRYDADRPRFWVREDDLELFAQHVDFDVLPDRIDEAAEREAARERRLAELEALVAATTAPPSERRPGPGRPPLDPDELALCWHLRHHGLRLWTTADLVARFLPDSYRAGGSTMRARLRRFAADFPERTHEEHCRFCQLEFFPDPGDDSEVPA